MTSFRPGARLSARPLHFFFVIDTSGSMEVDGKIQSLNNAIREAIPHLREVTAQNPFANVLVRALVFSSGTRWHIEQPTPVDLVSWTDVTTGGYTELGAALHELAGALQMPPMEQRAFPPVVVVISDGQPTDDFEAGLAALMAEPWGRRAVRLAIAIGRDADLDVLQAFIGDQTVRPFSARDPDQLAYLVRFVSTAASRLASTPAGAAAEADQLLTPELPSRATDMLLSW
ncbi:MAG: VWA domain-containing protein [Nocardioidaceae bacterium]